MRICILRHGKIGYAEQRLMEISGMRGHMIDIINPINTDINIGSDKLR
ncbi:MAG: hypothetical protein HZB65_04115 [Candidatus Aenigmarchaeota archaeon]|nr:hypothetical protein [Candidatus Aenigmarchaeota archaeon]